MCMFISSTLPDRVFCVQVLVVWDVSISKARNYRLFREVGDQQPAVMSWHWSNSQENPSDVLPCLSSTRITASTWTVTCPSPTWQPWSNTTTAILFLTTAPYVYRCPTRLRLAGDRARTCTLTGVSLCRGFGRPLFWSTERASGRNLCSSVDEWSEDDEWRRRTRAGQQEPMNWTSSWCVWEVGASVGIFCHMYKIIWLPSIKTRQSNNQPPLQKFISGGCLFFFFSFTFLNLSKYLVLLNSK